MSVALSAVSLLGLLAKRYKKTREASASLFFRQLLALFDTLRIYLNSIPEGL